VTRNVFDKLLSYGDRELGVEPIGIVLLYPEQAFLKAVWTDDANREDIAQGLLTAAADELSKA
jgi:hypothetical protein